MQEKETHTNTESQPRKGIDALVEGGLVDALTAIRMNKADREALKQSQLAIIQVTVANTPPFTFNSAICDLAEWHGRFDRHSNELMRVANVGDFERAKTECKTAVLLGFQSGDHLEGKLENLDFFFRLGIRQIQLTYNSLNALGAGCTERRDPGLSHLGIAVVKRMNDLGMIVDLSHCGIQTTLDAIDVSREPVVFSHANCRALNDNPRCKTDEEIRALAKKGGVVGITTVSFFVSAERECTADDFIAHVEHAVSVAGLDHVGIGSDSPVSGWRSYFPDEESFWKFHGQFGFKPSLNVRWPPFIPELDVPEKFLRIAERLVARGYSDEDIRKILGGNFLRVFREVLSAKTQPDGLLPEVEL